MRPLVEDSSTSSRRPFRYINEVEVLLSKLENSTPHASQQIVSYWHYNDIWSGLISTWPVSPRVATCLAAWRGHVVGVMNVSCSRVTGGATRSPQRGQPKYFEWCSNLKAAKNGQNRGQGAGKSWAEKGVSRWSEWLRRPCRCDAVSRAAGIYVLSAITRPSLPSHCHHTALIQMELSCSSPHTLTATLLLRRAWAEHWAGFRWEINGFISSLIVMLCSRVLSATCCHIIIQPDQAQASGEDINFYTSV